MLNILLALVFMFSCEIPQFEYNKNVIIEAYSTIDVPMALMISNGWERNDVILYQLEAKEVLRDTIQVLYTDLVTLTDRSFDGEYELQYSIYQENYEHEKKEVFCSNECWGESAWLYVKM